MPEFLQLVWFGKPLWSWFAFLGVVMTLLALDLGIFHRKAHEVNVKESMRSCAFYSTLGLLFSLAIYWLYSTQPLESMTDTQLQIANDAKRGWQAAQLYLTGYLVELSLSMDNVFVIALIFGFFKIPQRYQHRVLFWGIIGVVLFRAVMIGVGAALIAQFSWLMLVFGVFLVYAGAKMLRAGDGHGPDIAHNPVLLFIRRHFPVTHDLHGEKFFIRQRDPKTNRMILYMTPAFVALMMVEFADVIFAVDSVPAIFAITPDPYIVYTSNIFAILGLRSLYFTLAAMVTRFEYLKYALALILIMIGAKILLAEGLHIHLPNWLSLLATVGLLVGGVAYSLYRTRRQDGQGVGMKLLVGLGNPGVEYATTRHNIGFLALDALHEHLKTDSWQRKFHGTLASAGGQDNKLLLLKPQTFMNRSGLAVGEVCQFYKIQPADVLVFHDELELPPGRIRVKQGGGHAGHNGLKSLDAAIGADYWRIRLGIGRPPPERESVHDYVLQPFAKTDRGWLTALLAVLSREIDLLLSGKTSEYMNKITLALQGVLPHAPDMEKE